ncbi:hypothetical protein C0V77_19315 [Emticicia sp. TH156]|nr:hypothetical protein C0V77_19315 [Emticicia sp. TH156]
MKNIAGIYKLTNSRVFSVLYPLTFIFADILAKNQQLRYQLKVAICILGIAIIGFNYLYSYLQKDKKIATRWLVSLLIGIICGMAYVVYFKPKL